MAGTLCGGVSWGSEGRSSEMPLSLAAGDQSGELEAESPEPKIQLRKSSESGPGRTCWGAEGAGMRPGFAPACRVTLGELLTVSGPHSSFLEDGTCVGSNAIVWPGNTAQPGHLQDPRLPVPRGAREV